MSAPRVGGRSPWGTIQTVVVFAEGIVFVSTAGHGGFWLSPEREAQVPEKLRKVAREYAPPQWYEEDCDACIVGAQFADDIVAFRADHARFVTHCKDFMRTDARMLRAQTPEVH